MSRITWTTGGTLGGTSLQGEVLARESELRAIFGEPEDGDGYKVSREWVGQAYDEETGRILGVFTVYDWKDTSLYDEDLPTPEQYTQADEERVWNIGGHERAAQEWVRAILEEYRATSDHTGGLR